MREGRLDDRLQMIDGSGLGLGLGYTRSRPRKFPSCINYIMWELHRREMLTSLTFLVPGFSDKSLDSPQTTQADRKDCNWVRRCSNSSGVSFL